MEIGLLMLLVLLGSGLGLVFGWIWCLVGFGFWLGMVFGWENCLVWVDLGGTVS
jgi:hypothetical protein